MEYCQYHPVDAATHECNVCKSTSCDKCVQYDQERSVALCHICQKPTKSLGSAYSAQPFWRRLDQSFRYPINSQAITVIIGVAILSSIVTFMPFAWILVLIVNGSFFKYGFASLENSAYGDFTPVSISEAFEGGLSIMFQLIAILLGLTLMVVFCGYFLGATTAKLVGVIFLIGLPAIMINFALTKSVANALNPLAMVVLITTIGLPYGLLLAFIFIMIGSVGIITQLLMNVPSSIAVILESAVSSYYTLVIFHIMGYMIFQYQNKLGFTATENYGETDRSYSEIDDLKAEIMVWVKEGNADKVLELYNKAIGKYPNDYELFNMCYRFLIETRNIPRLKAFSRLYFDHLAHNNNASRMSQVFKEIRALDTKFIPKKAQHRHLIAESSFEKGDFMTAIKLLNDLHKSSPGYSKLGESYDILAEAFELSSKYKSRAGLTKKLANAFKKKQASQKIAAQKKAKNVANKDVIGKQEKQQPLNIDLNMDKPTLALEIEPLVKDGELPAIDFPGFNKKD